MKKKLITLMLSLTAFAAISQNVMYDIHGGYDRPVTKEILNKAGLISDFVEGYPVNWITDYVSVEIAATCHGKETKASGISNVLTINQKNLLRSAEMASSITVDVKYKYPNTVTDKIELRYANMSLTVIPYSEAEFPGGDKKMKKYFKEKGVNEIAEIISGKSEKLKIRFVINEDGNVSDVTLEKPCGNSGMNQKIIEAIKNMPSWKPAENADGVKVKQVFEFRVKNDEGC